MTAIGDETWLPGWFNRMFRDNLEDQGAMRRESFEQVIAQAREVAALDPLGLSSVVRLIAAPLQARAMSSAAYRATHGARSAYELADFFGELSAQVTPSGECVYDVVDRSQVQRYRLRLGRDPILAIPWTRSCLANALANIGHGRGMGAWRADFNHKVQLLLPFGLALAHGGNHSLTAGIVNAEGSVEADSVIDLSPLYAYLHYDGLSMIRTHDGCRLWEPVDEELGILFELGRLMLEHKVGYDVPQANGAGDDEQEGDSFPICYRVLFDGVDTGYSLSSSGATRVLQKAGIAPGSDKACSIIVEGAEFIHHDRAGKSVRVMLRHYERRPLVDGLERVTHLHLAGDD
ncbi:hypothetical protein CQW32_20420 [Pseudomonas putida]|uniref:DUF6710 family protein n=1 Tax=Pseudomonas putida TaxID=303 RepID=UPI000C2A2694|nr:DUF6710 family protein [Pseudomonas putida]PJX08593.1 hypothetical protein CQW32_20420 [Pseudomonas putida]